MMQLNRKSDVSYLMHAVLNIQQCLMLNNTVYFLVTQLLPEHGIHLSTEQILFGIRMTYGQLLRPTI